MGSFNIKCGITGTDICVGDSVVLIPIIQNSPRYIQDRLIPSKRWIYLFDTFAPIFATYNDYGQYELEDDDDTIFSVISLSKYVHLHGLTFDDDRSFIENLLSNIGTKDYEQCFLDIVENVNANNIVLSVDKFTVIGEPKYRSELAFFVFNKTCLDHLERKLDYIFEKWQKGEECDWWETAIVKANERGDLDTPVDLIRVLLGRYYVEPTPVVLSGQNYEYNFDLAEVTQLIANSMDKRDSELCDLGKSSFSYNLTLKDNYTVLNFKTREERLKYILNNLDAEVEGLTDVTERFSTQS